MYKFLRPLCGTLALLSIASTATAQVSIGVSATVTSQLTVSGTRALDFLNVLPGFEKTIVPGAATAGKFTLTGAAGANVSITLTLPTNLTSGVNNLTINTWDGCRNTVDAFSGCQQFSPVSGTAFTTPLGSGGVLVVFLGAKVVPTAGQIAATYTGTISMTAAYTGT
jgi:hypothetical protein